MLYAGKRMIDQFKDKWVLSRTDGKGTAVLPCFESKEGPCVVAGRTSRLSACKWMYAV